jgi:DNA polymerase
MSALSELCQEIALCQKCEVLVKSRTRVVPGDGPEGAGLMFIGEAPGWYEDQQGVPFVGPAGLFLEQLLTSVSLNRNQVYIANVMKCRPPSNRDPLPSELHNCREWLDRQIEIINPKIVVTLGRYSMAMFFSDKSISKIHGTAQKRGDIVYYAMYHPAAALHQRSLRRVIEDDMLKIPSLLAQVESVLEVKQPPQQLDMFEVENHD